MTTTTQGEHAKTEAQPIQRFEVVDCIDSKHVPAVIPRKDGPWVRYEDHAAELRRLHAQVAALTAAPSVSDGLRTLHDAILNRLSHAELLEKAHYLMELNSNQARTIGELQDLVEAATTQPAAPQGVAYAELPVAFGDGVLTSTKKHELWALAAAGCSDEQTSQKNLIWHIGAFAQLVEREAASNGQAPAQPCAKCGDDKAQHNGARCVNGSENSYFTPTAQAAPAAGAVAGPDDYTPLLDDEGRMMVGTSHHYTAENIRALVAEYKALEAGGPDTWELHYNTDHRARAGVLWRVISALADEVPFAAAPAPAAQAADSVLEDAARSERERICAAIKAEDDYCVDQGDYMLDSDDCIKIVRGEWVRPDFSVDAARKQGAKHD